MERIIYLKLQRKPKKKQFITIEGYKSVNDVHISVEEEEGSIEFFMIVGQAVKDEIAKERGEDIVRNLAANVNVYGNDLKGPSGEYLGQLYEEYDFNVYIGYSAEEVIFRGIKVNEENINWYGK